MTKLSLTRRNAMIGMGGAAAAGLLARPAIAQSGEFNIVGHNAHLGAATTGKGGDVVAAWAKAHNVKINWITMDVGQIMDRILREASLSQTSIDLGYIVYMTQPNLKLMAPIDDFVKSDPMDKGGLADFPPALINELKYEGSLRGLPIRITTEGLLYNEAILQERGIKDIPTTVEELAEVMRKCTFTRADGTKVHGAIFYAGKNLTDVYTNMSRAFDGDYMRMDSSITCNQPANVKSLELLKQLYDQGVYPAQSFTATSEECINYIGQGRAAFYVNAVTNVNRLNNPQFSPLAGRFKVMDWPMTESLKGKVPYAPILVSWSQVIPGNASPERKKLAWSLMKEMASYESCVLQALNGNGPYRVSATADPRLANEQFMNFHGQALKYGRPHVPAVPKAAQLNDVFVQAAQAAILGQKPIQKAMDDAAAEAKRLI